MVLYLILVATFCVSLISFAGALLFIRNFHKNQRVLLYMVSFAAGVLLATSFFDLIPESFEMNLSIEPQILSLFIFLGILSFYLIEKLIHWHHHHEMDCHNHHLSTLSLVGDGLHNFLDGILIATSFLADIRLGIVTTLAVVFHEIPQEIGDISILLHSGMSKFKALFWNFMSALTAVLGAVVGYLAFNKIESVVPLLVSFTAGMFIYLALADIIPEVNKEKERIHQITLSLIFLFAIGLTYTIGFLLGH